ncbi:MAG: PKD domain-containing protein, partial [Bacteroidia bacterium]|nr:PKD domain-containing protein [Bacteroidia bacterium]
MKRLFFILFSALSIGVYGQQYTMQNGSVTTCTGTFLDSGGNGNYSNNENFTFTICPDNPGQQLQLQFTQWATQSTDVMTIYNGPDTSYDVIGTFSGDATNNPGTIVASLTEINPGGLANPQGCLTITFMSDATANTVGWSANISCFEPCQDIEAIIDSTVPAVNADNVIRICQGDPITFNGDGIFSVDGTGATYSWDFDNGNSNTGQSVTETFNDEGIYLVTLEVSDTNPQGCTSTNFESVFVHVSTRPDFSSVTATDPAICFGESTTISGSAQPVTFNIDCANGGEQANLGSQGGLTYTSTLELDCFQGVTLTDASQLISICVIMEHTYIGDLEIIVISPSGQQVTLHNQQGAGLFLGNPIISDGTGPGTGWEYCFTMSAASLLYLGPTEPSGTPTPSATISAGDYLPIGDFNSFVGSTLNGEWTLFIEDHLNIDDGTIFSWSLNFDTSLIESDYTFTPVLTSESWDPDPTITNTVGNTITVEPVTAGTHCYTYRVTDDFGCEYTEQVCVEMYPEVIIDPPNNLVICDGGPPPYIFDLTQNDPVILASNPQPADFVVTYYETQADADSETNEVFTPGSYPGADGQTIYARIEYLSTDCYETTSFTLNLSTLPTIDPVADLETCDDSSNDGVEQFDLTVQDLGILGAQDPSIFSVSYYATAADASAGTNALVSPYTNIANPQPIYARVEASSDTSCFLASANPVFNLIVNLQGVANTPPDLEICDDASNDGFGNFDLESQTATVLGAQNPADFTVTYHETQADADADINPLVSPYTNTSNPQTIYFRVEENVNPSCYGTSFFQLIVNPLPDVIVMTPLEECDDDTDGFTQFNLNDKDAEAINGQTAITVSYYESQADADAAVNALVSPYTNLSNPQTVYIRLEDNVTGCFNTVSLDLIVNPIPITNVPTPLEVCDNDDDGFADFDLGLKDMEITGGTPGIFVSWHETFADAQNNSNALVIPYSNTVANTQTVYARVFNAATGCFDVVELVLIVNPLPDVITISPLELCDYNNPGDEIESFDLVAKDAEIINGQASMQVLYFESLADAQAQINAVVSPYNNISNPQNVWYSIENQITGCITYGNFDLVVNPLPVLVAPSPLVVCDDSVADGFTAIDLTIKNDEITGSNPDYAVTYYETQADADAGINQLAVPYTNTSNPQTIYARGEDINTGCYSTVALDLEVEQA